MESNEIFVQAADKLIANCPDHQNSTVAQQKQERLLDFSCMFKKNRFQNKLAPELGAERKISNQGPNWLLQIPAKIEITLDQLLQRRFLANLKWTLIAKGNSIEDSPLTAAVSCANYLYKINRSSQKINLSSMKQLIQQEKIQLENLTRRQIIEKCVDLLNKSSKNNQFQIQTHELIQQEGKNNEKFLEYLIKNLQKQNKTFIYVCYGQIFYPIGFEKTPLNPLDAYKKIHQINPQKLETWIINAGLLKNQGPFILKRWSDIEKQSTCRWPEFLDLEQAKKGKQIWPEGIKQVNCKARETSCWIELTSRVFTTV